MSTSTRPRNLAPSYLPEATRFSAETSGLTDPIQLVHRVKGVPKLMGLLAQTKVNHGHGPRRKPGNWALAYLAFVVSGHINLQPWYRHVANDRSLWRACGFYRVNPATGRKEAHIPAYPTVWERFAELEEFSDTFQEAAGELIRMARRKDERIGLWTYIDGTECQTHARSHHDCGPLDDCPGRHGTETLVKLDIAAASATRAELSEDEETAEQAQAPTPAPGNSGLRPVPPKARVLTSDGGMRYTAGGHWWRSRDREAGTRAYGNGRHWTGGMNVKLVDIFTGGVMMARTIPANHNEHQQMPSMIEWASEAMGTNPIALLADRGYSTDGNYDFLVSRDTTPVIQYRKRHPNSPDWDQGGPEWDRNGIPLCPGCGQPGDFHAFERNNSGPRLRFRCSLPSGPDCEGIHSISTRKAPRRLLPIWRTSRVYTALRGHVSVSESAHEEWRTHFRVAGKTFRDRPRRLGLACQNLRAAAAAVAQWVWIMVRQGWWDGPDGTPERPIRRAAVAIDGSAMYDRIQQARQRDHMVGGGYPRPQAAP